MSELAPVPDTDRLLLAGREVPPRVFGSLPLPATGPEVAQFVALRAAACVGADYSNLASLDEGGRSLRLFHGAFLAPEIADRYTDVPLDAPFPIAAAARTGTAILLPDLDAYRDRFLGILADTVAAADEHDMLTYQTDHCGLTATFRRVHWHKPHRAVKPPTGLVDPGVLWLAGSTAALGRQPV
jgi:hypothetical protein